MSRRPPVLTALPLLAVCALGLAACADQDPDGPEQTDQGAVATAVTETAPPDQLTTTQPTTPQPTAAQPLEPGDDPDDPIVVEIEDEQFLTNMAIYTRYVEAKEGPLDLRAPTASAREIADGKRQAYLTGTIYWSPQAGAHIVRGDILTAYLDTGGPAGPLGWPVGDEIVDGEVIHSDFEGGQIRLEDGEIDVVGQSG